MVNAIVTDIQHASVHDGPGIRTTVFFKGCPLSCKWCHNPECISKEPQVLYYPEKCIDCKQCGKGCFSGARVVCGKKMTADEIFAEIIRDKAYYADDGGVTFSGGEPMLHTDMLKMLISLCKANGIGTAIETSLAIFNEEILSSLDFIMADFKIWNDEKHKQLVGVSNAIIKDHFIRLDTLGVPFIVRTPVIPGINDTREEISNIRDFIKGFKNIKGYELLAYHPLGVSKQRALGLEEVRFQVPEKSKMEELRIYAEL